MKVNQEAVAPLAVLAQRVGLCELVDVCADANIKQYVSNLCGAFTSNSLKRFFENDLA